MGKGSRRNYHTQVGAQGDPKNEGGRQDYEANLRSERAQRNENWEEKLRKWESSDLKEKGFGKGQAKGKKGERNFVYMP